LTCIIGGSMTGKSTLLDGLRFTMQGSRGLPSQDAAIRKAIEARARNVFLSGNTEVTLESPAGDQSRAVSERFEMRFFSQGELKSLGDDPAAVEDLLFHLVPGKSAKLIEQRDRLFEFDEDLAQIANRVAHSHEQVGLAEQAFMQAEQARREMERFAEAGAGELLPAQQDVAETSAFTKRMRKAKGDVDALLEVVESVCAPAIKGPALIKFTTQEPTISALIAQAAQQVGDALKTLEQTLARGAAIEKLATSTQDELTRQVQKALVASGGSAEDLNAFESFARAAKHFDSYKAAHKEEKARLDKARDDFKRTLRDRDQLINRHRAEVVIVQNQINENHQRVRVRIQDEGLKFALSAWIAELRNGGITKWWNSLGESTVTPSKLRNLLRALDTNNHDDADTYAEQLGLSPTLAKTFVELLIPLERRMALWSIRCPDLYRLQWKEGEDTKDLNQLSGGRKVAVLLSLLLESDDTTPLVIDQPEDELDNRFLNETIIPALHRLKGRRQVIFATHDANLVVNADADLVIALEATATQGCIDQAGAIEEPLVRDAIVKTLDGGATAFGLRRNKYGF